MLKFHYDDGERYSVWLDRNGYEVYLLNNKTVAEMGRIVRLVELDDLDLEDQWVRYREAKDLHEYQQRVVHWTGEDFQDFRSWIAALLIDPYEADDMRLCDRDDKPDVYDGFSYTRDGDILCHSCMDLRYLLCEDCEEYTPRTDTHRINDRNVCGSCIGDTYSWCDHCEEYYHYDDSYEHDHNSGCDCESPAREFTFPWPAGQVSDGSDTGTSSAVIEADQMIEASLPAGMISEAGINEIQEYLYKQACNPDYELTPEQEQEQMTGVSGFAHPVYARHIHHPLVQARYLVLSNEVGPEWQTKKGNFTKRLARAVYKSQHEYKIPEAVLAEIGNIARRHSKGSEITVSLTRDLNQSADDFVHEGSCWWTDYSYSRCTLKSNGGMGMRSWGENNGWGQAVTGRAWVIPLKQTQDGLRPTFDCHTATAFVVFNGYEELSDYTAPRVLAGMLGMTYKHVDAEGDWNMYVNSGGYLVSDQATLDAVGSSLTLNMSTHSSLHGDEQNALAGMECSHFEPCSH